MKSGLSSRSLGEAIVRAFQNRKADYTLNGVTFISLPPEIKPDPLKLDFSVSGIVDFQGVFILVKAEKNSLT